jgi:hypothetical protein
MTKKAEKLHGACKKAEGMSGGVVAKHKSQAKVHPIKN